MTISVAFGVVTSLTSISKYFRWISLTNTSKLTCISGCRCDRCVTGLFSTSHLSYLTKVDVIRETGPDGREVSQSAAEQPTIKSTTFTDSPSTPSSQFSTCSSISAPSDVMQGKKSRLKQQCLDQSSDQMGLVRRSTRQRVHPSDLIVQGSSDQPLQHLKVQLMQLTGVIPSDQHLMFKVRSLSIMWPFRYFCGQLRKLG